MKPLPDSQPGCASHKDGALPSCASVWPSNAPCGRPCHDNTLRHGTTSRRTKLKGELTRSRTRLESASTVLDSACSSRSRLDGNWTTRDSLSSVRISRQTSTTASTVQLLTPTTTDRNRPFSSRPVSSLISPAYPGGESTDHQASPPTAVGALVGATWTPAVRHSVTSNFDEAATGAASTASICSLSPTSHAGLLSEKAAEDTDASVLDSTDAGAVRSAAAGPASLFDPVGDASRNARGTLTQWLSAAEATNVLRHTAVATAPPLPFALPSLTSAFCPGGNQYGHASREFSEDANLQTSRETASRPLLQHATLPSGRAARAYSGGSGTPFLHNSTAAAAVAGAGTTIQSSSFTATMTQTQCTGPAIVSAALLRGQRHCVTTQQQPQPVLHDDDANSLASFTSSSWTDRDQTGSPAEFLGAAKAFAAVMRDQEATRFSSAVSNKGRDSVSDEPFIGTPAAHRRCHAPEPQAAPARVPDAHPDLSEELRATSSPALPLQIGSPPAAGTTKADEIQSLSEGCTQRAPATAAAYGEESLPASSVAMGRCRWSRGARPHSCHTDKFYGMPSDQSFLASRSGPQEGAEAERSTANRTEELQTEQICPDTAVCHENSCLSSREHGSGLRQQPQQLKGTDAEVPQPVSQLPPQSHSVSHLRVEQHGVREGVKKLDENMISNAAKGGILAKSGLLSSARGVDPHEAAAINNRETSGQHPEAALEGWEKSAPSKKSILSHKKTGGRILSQRTGATGRSVPKREQDAGTHAEEKSREEPLACPSHVQPGNQQPETDHRPDAGERQEDDTARHALEREREQTSQAKEQLLQPKQVIDPGEQPENHEQRQQHRQQQQPHQQQQHQQQRSAQAEVPPQQQNEHGYHKLVNLPPLSSLSPSSRRALRSRMRQWMLLRERRQQQQQHATQGVTHRKMQKHSVCSSAVPSTMQPGGAAEVQKTTEEENPHSVPGADAFSAFLRTAEDSVKTASSPDMLSLFKKLSETLGTAHENCCAELQKCREQLRDLHHLRFSVLKEQEQTQKAQQSFMEVSRQLVEEKQKYMQLSRRYEHLSSSFQKFKETAQLLVNVTKPSVEEIFLQPGATPLKLRHFVTYPEEVPQDNPSSSLKHLKALPCQEHVRQQNGCIQSAELHQHVLSCEKIAWREQIPVHSKPRSSSTATRAPGRTAARRRTASSRGEVELFASRRRYLGPAKKPGGLVRVVYLPCEEVEPLQKRIVALEERLAEQDFLPRRKQRPTLFDGVYAGQQRLYDETINFMQRQKAEQDGLHKAAQESHLLQLKHTTERLQEEEAQLFEAREKLVNTRQRLQKLVLELETQKEVNKRQEDHIECLAELQAQAHRQSCCTGEWCFLRIRRRAKEWKKEVQELRDRAVAAEERQRLQESTLKQQLLHARRKLKAAEIRRRFQLDGLQAGARDYQRKVLKLESWMQTLELLLKTRLRPALSARDAKALRLECEDLQEQLRQVKLFFFPASASTSLTTAPLATAAAAGAAVVAPRISRVQTTAVCATVRPCTVGSASTALLPPSIPPAAGISSSASLLNSEADTSTSPEDSQPETAGVRVATQSAPATRIPSDNVPNLDTENATSSAQGSPPGIRAPAATGGTQTCHGGASTTAAVSQEQHPHKGEKGAPQQQSPNRQHEKKKEELASDSQGCCTQKKGIQERSRPPQRPDDKQQQQHQKQHYHVLERPSANPRKDATDNLQSQRLSPIFTDAKSSGHPPQAAVTACKEAAIPCREQSSAVDLRPQQPSPVRADVRSSSESKAAAVSPGKKAATTCRKQSATAGLQSQQSPPAPTDSNPSSHASQAELSTCVEAASTLLEPSTAVGLHLQQASPGSSDANTSRSTPHAEPSTSKKAAITCREQQVPAAAARRRSLVIFSRKAPATLHEEHPLSQSASIRSSSQPEQALPAVARPTAAAPQASLGDYRGGHAAPADRAVLFPVNCSAACPAMCCCCSFPPPGWKHGAAATQSPEKIGTTAARSQPTHQPTCTYPERNRNHAASVPQQPPQENMGGQQLSKQQRQHLQVHQARQPPQHVQPPAASHKQGVLPLSEHLKSSADYSVCGPQVETSSLNKTSTSHADPPARTATASKAPVYTFTEDHFDSGTIKKCTSGAHSDPACPFVDREKMTCVKRADPPVTCPDVGQCIRRDEVPESTAPEAGNKLEALVSSADVQKWDSEGRKPLNAPVERAEIRAFGRSAPSSGVTVLDGESVQNRAANMFAVSSSQEAAVTACDTKSALAAGRERVRIEETMRHGTGSVAGAERLDAPCIVSSAASSLRQNPSGPYVIPVKPVSRRELPAAVPTATTVPVESVQPPYSSGKAERQSSVTRCAAGKAAAPLAGTIAAAVAGGDLSGVLTNPRNASAEFLTPSRPPKPSTHAGGSALANVTTSGHTLLPDSREPLICMSSKQLPASVASSSGDAAAAACKTKASLQRHHSRVYLSGNQLSSDATSASGDVSEGLATIQRQSPQISVYSVRPTAGGERRIGTSTGQMLLAVSAGSDAGVATSIAAGAVREGRQEGRVTAASAGKASRFDCIGSRSCFSAGEPEEHTADVAALGGGGAATAPTSAPAKGEGCRNSASASRIFIRNHLHSSGPQSLIQTTPSRLQPHAASVPSVICARGEAGGAPEMQISSHRSSASSSNVPPSALKYVLQEHSARTAAPDVEGTQRFSTGATTHSLGTGRSADKIRHPFSQQLGREAAREHVAKREEKHQQLQGPENLLFSCNLPHQVKRGQRAREADPAEKKQVHACHTPLAAQLERPVRPSTIEHESFKSRAWCERDPLHGSAEHQQSWLLRPVEELNTNPMVSAAAPTLIAPASVIVRHFQQIPVHCGRRVGNHHNSTLL